MKNDSFVFLWKGQLLFIGNSVNTRIHKHHAVQIGISFDKPFQMKVKNNKWQDCKAIIVGSNRDHECTAEMRRVLFISIDPESETGRMLSGTYLKGCAFNTIDNEKADQYLNSLNNVLNKPVNRRKISDITNQFINSLLPADNRSGSKLDPRIRQIITILQNSPWEKISLKELAEKVSLSEGRLVHLFKEQMGLPVRKYRLWLKLNIAIESVINKTFLTESAYNAGFSDSAHFSRTFSRMFGISPSKLIKNSQIVQVFNFSR